jgi:Ser/Thr protein kinase RdoA (MazF antagonist)
MVCWCNPITLNYFNKSRMCDLFWGNEQKGSTWAICDSLKRERMKSFEELSYRGQIQRLKRTAERALACYDLPAARLTPLTNTENMTFRVDLPTGARHVLRIHRPSAKSAAAITSELLWLAALRRDTDLIVPDPVPARNGVLVVEADAPGVPGPRCCVLFRWVDGDFAGDRLGVKEIERVGEFMARLHNHAALFEPPPGFTRGRLGREAFAADALAPCLRAPGQWLDQADVALIDAARQLIYERLAVLGEAPHLFGLIHADLHQWNYLFRRGAVRAIDFDDCCWSYYLYDLAVTLLMLHEHVEFQALYAAFFAGYRSIRPISPEQEAQLETFMIVRRFILMSWLISQTHNPDLAGWARVFVPDSLRALRAFIGSGGVHGSSSEPISPSPIRAA